MTALTADTSAFFGDTMYCAGLGIWLAFFCHLCELLIPRGMKAARYIAHIVYGALAGFVVFAYIIGKSAAGEPRWFIFAGLALGAAVYALALSSAVSIVAGAFAKVIKLALALIYRLWSATLGKVFHALGAFLSKKLSELGTKTTRILQILRKRVYNFFVGKHRSKRKGAGDGTTVREKTKRPLKAVTRT